MHCGRTAAQQVMPELQLRCFAFMPAMRATKSSAARSAESEARNRGLPGPRVVTIPDCLALDGTLHSPHQLRPSRAIRNSARNEGFLLQLLAGGPAAIPKSELQSRV